jgi:hypothetical protein
MTYIAAAELAVILILVLLYRKARDHEVQAILDVMADNTAERAELLNAARQPNYLMQGDRETNAVPISAEDLERIRANAAAYAQVGQVAEPE